MIHVTKSYLPDIDTYIEKIKLIWENHWLTNNGPLLTQLEEQLKRYVGTEHLLYTNNGTIVLQMALKALGITKEVITTPFSYVATTNSILWEGCTPIFADINEYDFNIDADLIESKITDNTQAILVTHVFGNPCDVEKIEAIAKKHSLKVIYDAAHAFGVEYKGKSLLTYGDMSTCSFHATKVFHTIEGGCITANDNDLFRKLYLYRQFGHEGDDYYDIGINAKASEFHAAMGLCVLDALGDIISHRKNVSIAYDRQLNFNKIRKPISPFEITYNYAYYPVVFESEEIVLNVKAGLEANGIMARRYFYPSLNTLPFLQKKDVCLNSELISKKILCLPLSSYLQDSEVDTICRIINTIIE
jgi:dTDP-4-amino-4,6-dideoxygalactose transaminase